MLPGANTFWTDLFVRHFLFETEASMQDSDDLLFFVRYKHIKGSSRTNPKYEVGFVSVPFDRLLAFVFIPPNDSSLFCHLAD